MLQCIMIALYGNWDTITNNKQLYHMFHTLHGMYSPSRQFVLITLNLTRTLNGMHTHWKHNEQNRFIWSYWYIKLFNFCFGYAHFFFTWLMCVGGVKFISVLVMTMAWDGRGEEGGGGGWGWGLGDFFEVDWLGSKFYYSHSRE